MCGLLQKAPRKKLDYKPQCSLYHASLHMRSLSPEKIIKRYDVLTGKLQLFPDPFNSLHHYNGAKHLKLSVWIALGQICIENSNLQAFLRPGVPNHQAEDCQWTTTPLLPGTNDIKDRMLCFSLNKQNVGRLKLRGHQVERHLSCSKPSWDLWRVLSPKTVLIFGNDPKAWLFCSFFVYFMCHLLEELQLRYTN